MKGNQDQACFFRGRQAAENAVSGYDGHYPKMDRRVPELEYNPIPGCLPTLQIECRTGPIES